MLTIILVGMGLDKHKGKWRVRLMVDGVMHEIGHFDCIDEANERLDHAKEHPWELANNAEEYYHMTHQQIADELKITRQAVVRLEKAALAKIRKKPWALKILGEFLLD